MRSDRFSRPRPRTSSEFRPRPSESRPGGREARPAGLERPAGPDFAARLFARPEAALALVKAAWPHAVGPELARRTEVLALESGTLRVRVPDARWRGVLNRMQPDILGRLRAIAGSLAPRRLGFNEGAVVRDASDEPGDAPREPAPVAEDLAASAAAIADPDVRDAFLRSAASYLARTRS